jgi:rhomboid-like protein
MSRWFTHHPQSGKSITLLTSTFSHQGFLHLAFNMFGLWTFGSLVHDSLGSREEFLAFYTSAGVISAFASHALSLRTMLPSAIVASLGASGALFACLGAVTIMHPHIQVGILFIPGISFELQVNHSSFIPFRHMINSNTSRVTWK